MTNDRQLQLDLKRHVTPDVFFKHFGNILMINSHVYNHTDICGNAFLIWELIDHYEFTNKLFAHFLFFYIIFTHTSQFPFLFDILFHLLNKSMFYEWSYFNRPLILNRK